MVWQFPYFIHSLSLSISLTLYMVLTTEGFFEVYRKYESINNVAIYIYMCYICFYIKVKA